MLKRTISLIALAAALSGRAFAAADQWIEVRSPHFTVLSDANEKQTRHILDQFERMRWVFQTLFPKANVDPIEPIMVVAAKNERAFDALTPAAYLGKGKMQLGGYFEKTPDKNYVLLNLDRSPSEHPYATIYHEYTHLQFSADLEWLPIWLNEGVAEFFQNTEIRDKDVQLGEASVDDILYLRQNRIIPLTVLFTVDRNSPYYHEEQKGSVFYAEAWAMTHYLEITDRVKGTSNLPTYMDLVRKGADPVAAAQQAFGDLNKLQAALESYIQESSYKQFVLSSAAAPIDESTWKVRPVTQAEADAVRADVLSSVGRADEARTLLEAVLKADPNNVQALETMGSLAFRAGNIQEARKWYGRAVKLDSQNYLAHYYFAALSMQTGAEDQDAEIEASLRAAIQLNPRFAPAYDRLAAFLGTRNKNLDEAHRMNIQAIELDPGNLGYRMNTANVLVTMGRFSDAISVLRAAQKIAGNPQDTATVARMIAYFEQVQADRARADADEQSAGAGGVVGLQESTVVDVTPKHPNEPATGPKHTIEGVIRNVACSYPAVLEFKVVNPKTTVSLYTNNLSSIDLTVLGFTPKGDMNPCNDFEGMKARVQYAESSDKTVDGQVVAVELKK